MEKSYSESYAAAGVDITAGYRSVELMKQYVARTMNEHCIGGLGGFGGLFELDCTGYKHPVLISGTDGVGTKLKLAMLLNKHDTIGIDCVAMCVNDVICAGAKPLVFLDYIACGRNIPEKIAEIVKGVAEGCVQADCSLVGGETAEHPGMMPEDEYDLAGFTVGVVDKEKILSNETMKPGDVILALPSTGVHSNGFSLVRKIFDIDNDPDVLKTAPAELGGKTLGEALLAPTKIYVKPVLKVLEEVDVKGISHITGGGFYENIPRSLKKGCCARIRKADVRTPALFHLMEKAAQIAWTKFLFERLPSFTDERHRLAVTSHLLSEALKGKGGEISASHIIPFIIGENEDCIQTSLCLQRKGFYCLPVRPPTVPKGTARIRFSLTADITEEEIRFMINEL